MDLNQGAQTLFAYCEKIILIFSLNSARVRAIGWHLLGFFFSRDFCTFLKGGLGGKSFIGNIK